MSIGKHHVSLEVIRPVTLRDSSGNIIQRWPAGYRTQSTRDCGRYWETTQGRLYKYEARIVGRAFKIG